MALSPGMRLGPYEIVAAIGAGGMGEVYRAIDTTLGRAVAIKVLPEAFAADAERLARFEREARTLAALNHPNLAHIYAVDRSQATPSIVMELVEGPTLADRVASGPLPVDEALRIARQIAEAIEAAHEQGIVHRDLKPANVKVRDDGTVKVLDFGLAKVLEPVRATGPASFSPTITSPVMMTGVGTLLGTAAYMSPEQAKGRTADKRSDVWAFGCVVYEMLTGGRAFDGDEPTEVLASVIKSDPDWSRLPPLPATLTSFLRRCLAKDPKQRIHDIADVRLALEGAFETSGESVPAPTIARPLWRRTLPAAIASIITALVTTFAVSLWLRDPAPRAINRFGHRVPANQTLRGNGRSVMALSPDGRHLVYNTFEGLYLRSMDSLEARLISTETDTSLTSPFFAPDGQSLGFAQGGQLKRISLNGGAPIVICPITMNPFGVSWSPDNTILFAEAAGIMRVPANGGRLELVVAAKEGEQMNGPQLLPGGDAILFSATTAQGETRWDMAEIAVQSLSSGTRTRLVSGGSDARYVATGHLVYAVADTLFAVAFDLAQLQVRGSPVSVVQRVTRAGNPTTQSGTANYAVADDGTLVFLDRETTRGFTTGGAGIPLSEPVWVNRQGGEEPLGAPARQYVYARISPDGTRVALDARDRDQDIWMWDLRRQTLSRFTISGASDIMPVWSPDGNRLAWSSQREGAANLYWQAADGIGSAIRLTTSPNQQRPSTFTPDGQHLLFSEGAPGSSQQDLGLLAMAGEHQLRWLLKTPSWEFNGEISPDGRWLAYESMEAGQSEVFVRPFPAIDQGRWPISNDGGRAPAWARNGRELYYEALDGSLMAVPVDVAPGSGSFTAGMATKVVPAGGYYTRTANQLGRTYDVSADGKRFLRIKIKDSSALQLSPSNFVIIQNWTEELKRLVPRN